LGSKDAWCQAVEHACAEVGIEVGVCLVHVDDDNPWNVGSFRISGPGGTALEASHEQFHAIHKAMVICEPLRRCRPSSALSKALEGAKICGDGRHAGCAIRERCA
jgi:hypothetical protein